MSRPAFGSRHIYPGPPNPVVRRLSVGSLRQRFGGILGDVMQDHGYGLPRILLLLDFSHLAAQETASANGSMIALRLSSGWCALPTRKKSLTFTDYFLVRTRRPSCSGRTAERIIPKEMGLEKPQSSPFQSTATFFLAKIREQGIGASRAGLSLSGWVRSIPTPSALNWLKSSSTRFGE